MTRKNIIKIFTIGFVLFLALPLIFEEDAAMVSSAQAQQSAYSEEGDDDLMGVIDINNSKKGKALPKQDAGFLKKFVGKIASFYTGGFAGRRSKDDKFIFADASVALSNGSSSASQAGDGVQSGMLNNDEAPLPVRAAYDNGGNYSGNGGDYAYDTFAPEGRQIVHRDIAVQGLYDASSTAPYEERAKAKKAYSSVMKKIGADASPSAVVASSKKSVVVNSSDLTASNKTSSNKDYSSPIAIASKGSSVSSSSRGGSSASFAGGGVAAGGVAGSGSLGNIEAITAGVQADVRQTASELPSFTRRSAGSSSGNTANGDSSSGQNNPNQSNNGGQTNPPAPGHNHNQGGNNGGNGNNNPGSPKETAFNPDQWQGCHIKEGPAQDVPPTASPGFGASVTTNLNPALANFVPQVKNMAQDAKGMETGAQDKTEASVTESVPATGSCEMPSPDLVVNKVSSQAKDYKILVDAGTIKDEKGNTKRAIPTVINSLVFPRIEASPFDFAKEGITTTDFSQEGKNYSEQFVLVDENDFKKVASRKDVVVIDSESGTTPASFASWDTINGVVVPAIDKKAIQKKHQNARNEAQDKKQKSGEVAQVKDLVNKKK